MASHVVGDHIHPTLEIFLEDQEVEIPADIGLTSSRHYNPHTHDTTGVLHIGEGSLTGIDPTGSPARLTTLEDFFDVWRTTNPGTSRNNSDAFFSQERILNRFADPTHFIRMTVNGQRNLEFEKYSPHDLDQVVISLVEIINQEPQASPQTVSTTAGAATSVTLSGDDGDQEVQQSLAFRIQSLPANGTLRDSSGAVVSTGTTLPSPNLTYTPSNGFTGSDSFAFLVQDNGGTADGGDDTSSPATVTIDVAPAPNQKPGALPQSIAVRAGGSRTIQLTGDDGDADAQQALSFRIQSLPEHGTLRESNGNSVSIGSELSTPTVIYTPEPDFMGSDAFAFVVQDDGGTAGGGQDTSDPATIALQVVNSLDPNDILGPAGVGQEHWVASSEPLSFTIRFENDATATAPAQEIVVQTALDPDLDWSTFRFGDIGFASTRVESSEAAQSFEATVEWSAGDGAPLHVNIAARLDLQMGVATWMLEAADPTTGELPEDPLAGFLLPNDDSGRGDGFLRFDVSPRTDRPTGTRIDVVAGIRFDTNPVIETNRLFYSIAVGSR